MQEPRNSRRESRLIVTADDVGLHPGITDGALLAHDAGSVTACSVVAGGPDLERAAAELRARPELDVGLHLALVGIPPVSPPEAVASLVPGGQPIPDYHTFLTRLALGRIHLGDVEREARAQIARARAAGLHLSHLDGHQHLHVAPGVGAVVARVAREEGIPYVRTPYEPWTPLGPRGPAMWALGLVGRRARRGLRALGLVTNDRAIGLRHAGHLTYERIVSALDRVKGVTELVTHPGLGNHLIAPDLRWGYDWDGEREALCRPDLGPELARRGIRLARMRDVSLG